MVKLVFRKDAAGSYRAETEEETYVIEKSATGEWTAETESGRLLASGCSTMGAAVGYAEHYHNTFILAD